jgi:hypothetical protein
METVLIVIFGLLYGLGYLIAVLWLPILVVIAFLSLDRMFDDVRVIIKDKRQQIDASKPLPDAERQRRAKLDAEIRAKMDTTVKRAQAERRAG